MISYKEFCDHVKDHITDFLPEEYQQASVIVQKVEKNNGLVLQGLSIKKEEETIAPCIYLEQYYEEYSNGYGIKEVMREIGTVYMDYKSRENDISIPQNLTDYESVKDQLIAQVVNTWRNMDRIESIPHVDREDLSFIFKIMVDMDDQGRGTITINNELMKVWGITTEQLREYYPEHHPQKVVLSAEADSFANAFDWFPLLFSSNYPNGRFPDPAGSFPRYSASVRRLLYCAASVASPTFTADDKGKVIIPPVFQLKRKIPEKSQASGLLYPNRREATPKFFIFHFSFFIAEMIRDHFQTDCRSCGPQAE